MSLEFVSGSYFKSFCKYSVGQYDDARTPRYVFEVKEELDNSLVFVKAEYLQQFASDFYRGNLELQEDFILLTHNSDINITNQVADIVLSWFPKMKRWYAQNLCCTHEKLRPLPIGLANPKWSHGNVDRFTKIVNDGCVKDKIYYANFNVATNPLARNDCIRKTGINITTNYPNFLILEEHDKFVNSTQDSYLRDMASSYFVVSPVGNGLDCHKTWEAIYMKSVPIVTQSSMSQQFVSMGLPILVINDWSEFRNLELSAETYAKIWNQFDIASLSAEFFIEELAG